MAYALQKNTGSRRRIKLLLSVIAIGFVYAIYIFIHQMSLIEQQEMKSEVLQKKLAAFEQTHQSVELKKSRLNDPEFIIQNDRKMLHMTKPNEMMFILQGDGQ